MATVPRAWSRARELALGSSGAIAGAGKHVFVVNTDVRKGLRAYLGQATPSGPPPDASHRTEPSGASAPFLTTCRFPTSEVGRRV